MLDKREPQATVETIGEPAAPLRLAEFAQRMGVSQKIVESWRRAGMPVIQPVPNGTVLVDWQQAMDWLRSTNRREQAPSPRPPSRKRKPAGKSARVGGADLDL